MAEIRDILEPFYTVCTVAVCIVVTELRFENFGEFYPYYLSQHRNRVNQHLHFTGNLCVIALVIAAIVTRIWWLFALTLVAGYGFAWIGHFFFERNRPATFTHPLYSLMGDWMAFVQTLAGRRPSA